MPVIFLFISYIRHYNKHCDVLNIIKSMTIHININQLFATAKFITVSRKHVGVKNTPHTSEHIHLPVNYLSTITTIQY